MESRTAVLMNLFSGQDRDRDVEDRFVDKVWGRKGWEELRE